MPDIIDDLKQSPTVESAPIPDTITPTVDSADSSAVIIPSESSESIDSLADFSVDFVAALFPAVSRRNIEKYLPEILSAFKIMGLIDKKLVLLALATIRVESVRFEPISEYKSKFNTSPDGHPFNLYDNRADLGNRGEPDGERFRGRGFIQLTGRVNYAKYSERLKLSSQLIDNPDLANDPAIASRLLAHFILDKEARIKRALEANDLKSARRAINGGSHGLKEFSEAYQKGLALLTV